MLLLYRFVSLKRFRIIETTATTLPPHTHTRRQVTIAEVNVTCDKEVREKKMPAVHSEIKSPFLFTFVGSLLKIRMPTVSILSDFAHSSSSSVFITYTSLQFLLLIAKFHFKLLLPKLTCLIPPQKPLTRCQEQCSDNLQQQEESLPWENWPNCPHTAHVGP